MRADRLAARFDHDELKVEAFQYFHDDAPDPFATTPLDFVARVAAGAHRLGRVDDDQLKIWLAILSAYPAKKAIDILESCFGAIA